MQWQRLTPWRGWRGRWWPWRSGSPAWSGCRSAPRGRSRRTAPRLRSRGWWPPARRRALRPDTWCSTRSILQKGGDSKRRRVDPLIQRQPPLCGNKPQTKMKRKNGAGCSKITHNAARAPLMMTLTATPLVHCCFIVTVQKTCVDVHSDKWRTTLLPVKLVLLLIIASFTVGVCSLGAQLGALNITWKLRYMLSSCSKKRLPLFVFKVTFQKLFCVFFDQNAWITHDRILNKWILNKWLAIYFLGHQRRDSFDLGWTSTTLEVQFFYRCRSMWDVFASFILAFRAFLNTMQITSVCVHISISVLVFHNSTKMTTGGRIIPRAWVDSTRRCW